MALLAASRVERLVQHSMGWGTGKILGLVAGCVGETYWQLTLLPPGLIAPFKATSTPSCMTLFSHRAGCNIPVHWFEGVAQIELYDRMVGGLGKRVVESSNLDDNQLLPQDSAGILSSLT